MMRSNTPILTSISEESFTKYKKTDINWRKNLFLLYIEIKSDAVNLKKNLPSLLLAGLRHLIVGEDAAEAVDLPEDEEAGHGRLL
jgi:hypothetical protein